MASTSQTHPLKTFESHQHSVDVAFCIETLQFLFKFSFFQAEVLIET